MLKYENINLYFEKKNEDKNPIVSFFGSILGKSEFDLVQIKTYYLFDII